METIHSWTPLVAISVSLVAAVLIVLFGKHKNIREFWTLLAAVTKFGLVLSMLPLVLSGQIPETVILTLTDGISLKLRVDLIGAGREARDLEFATLAGNHRHRRVARLVRYDDSSEGHGDPPRPAYDAHNRARFGLGRAGERRD